MFIATVICYLTNNIIKSLKLINFILGFMYIQIKNTSHYLYPLIKLQLHYISVSCGVSLQLKAE